MLLRSNVSAYLLPTWAIYCFPVVMMSTTLYAGIFAPAVSFLSFFLLTLFFELPRMRGSRLLMAAMIVSFGFSFAAPFYSPNSEERQFARAIYTGHIESNIAEFKDLSDYLLKHDSSPDSHGRHDILSCRLSRRPPKRFILPYRSEFDTALASPRSLARFVVGSRNTHADAVTSIHQTIADGYLPGYRQVYSTKHYLVFERKVS